jgi:hypothetical protein
MVKANIGCEVVSTMKNIFELAMMLIFIIKRGLRRVFETLHPNVGS